MARKTFNFEHIPIKIPGLAFDVQPIQLSFYQSIYTTSSLVTGFR
jgi:hypothetical protein